MNDQTAVEAQSPEVQKVGNITYGQLLKMTVADLETLQSFVSQAKYEVSAKAKTDAKLQLEALAKQLGFEGKVADLFGISAGKPAPAPKPVDPDAPKRGRAVNGSIPYDAEAVYMNPNSPKVQSVNLEGISSSGKRGKRGKPATWNVEFLEQLKTTHPDANLDDVAEITSQLHKWYGANHESLLNEFTADPKNPNTYIAEKILGHFNQIIKHEYFIEKAAEAAEVKKNKK